MVKEKKISMFPRTKITTYNKKAINLWEEEIVSTCIKIQTSERDLNKAKEIKNKITIDRVFYKQEFAKKTELLNKRFNFLQENQRNLNVELSLASPLNDPQIQIFTEELKGISERLEGLESDEQNEQKIIDEYQAKLTRWKKELQCLQKQTHAAKEFLKRLEDNPEDLFTLHLDKIFNQLSDFDHSVYEQDDRMRLCFVKLAEKKYKLATASATSTFNNHSAYQELDTLYRVFSEARKQKQDNANEKNRWRQHFACLNGFLFDLKRLYCLDNSKASQSFINLLNTLLEDMHIPEEGDLPDHLATGLSTHRQFRLLKEEYKEIFAMTPEVLLEFEEKKFQAEHDRLQNFIRNGNQHTHKQAAKLLSAIDEYILERKRKPGPVIYKDYTRLMQQATNIYEALEDKTWNEKTDIDFKHFSESASEMPGKTSTGRRVTGAILGTIGLVLLTTSVTVAAISFGGFAVPSLLGIAISGTLIIKAAALLGIATGASLSAGGWSLFHQGRQKGLAHTVEENAETMSAQRISSSHLKK